MRMEKDKTRNLDLLFRMDWKSGVMQHSDTVLVQKLSLWRDCLPEKLIRMIRPLGPGESATAGFHSEELFCGTALAETVHLPESAVLKSIREKGPLSLIPGRWYPKGGIRGITGIFPGNMEPCRCRAVSGAGIQVDAGHPMAGRSLELTATVLKEIARNREMGGSSRDFQEMIGYGPGMQARDVENDGPETAFWDLTRPEAPDDDAVFYRTPRMVHHLDAKAREIITSLYNERLPGKGDILDLMASHDSHLGDGLPGRQVVGLGMNQEELAHNPGLSAFDVWDLNADPRLPYGDLRFQGAVCTASIEYLTDPLPVIRDLGRVMMPGAPLITTFSDRWFPTQAIRYWTFLHPFERMGYVADLLIRSGMFTDLETVSVQGYPRPEGDPYVRERLYSDPVFAVLARRTAA